MSKVESFTYTKSVTVGIPPTTKSFGLTVRLPDQFTEEGLHEAISRAEMMIDEVLKQPEIPSFPNFDLEQINQLPWRSFTKGSASGSAKKGYSTPEGILNSDERPGWCFREDDVKLAEAIEKITDGKLVLGEWTFTLRGKEKGLINRSKREKK